MKTHFNRRLAIALAVSQALYPVAGYGTDLSDIPMAVINSVKPNVMMTIDDSGSMQFEVVPESSDVYFTFPRANPLYGANWGYGDSFNTVARFNIDNKYARYFRTAQFNPLYYNPRTRYLPWSNADASVMTNSTATAACHNPNKCPAITSGSADEGSLDLTVDHTWDVEWRNDSGSETQAARTYYPATFFEYNGTSPAPTNPTDVNNIETRFTLREIRSTTTSYVYTSAPNRTDCSVASNNTATCTYAQEIQNFANWYTYYRSRILSARAGIGRAFARQQAASMRVGFGAINKDSTSVDDVSTKTVVRGVRLFSGTDRTNFFSDLYGYIMPSAGTPLRRALDDVGQYFSRTDDKGPWGETPGASGGTQHACRQNFNILMTDGYWNGDAATTATGNIDNTNGSTISRPDGSILTPATYTYAPANPYSDSYSNSLADVAMYYWKNDLRSNLTNIVPSDTLDPAFWQHMVTYTVGFGVSGTISKAAIDSAFTTNPDTITWPDPSVEDSPNKIDDLAHAAVNSRGGFYSAANPDAFATALSSALDDVVGRNGSAAAVAVSNANVTSGDNASYASSYNSGNWTGDLQSYPLDLGTGEPNIGSPNWSTTAQAQLNTRTATSVTYASTNRNIVTYSGTSGTGQGKPFQPFVTGCTSNCISSTQQARLATPYIPPGTADGAAVVEYLRGKRTGETDTYRSRSAMLGDIINAEPVIIREPLAGYADDCYKNAKSGKCTADQTFKTLQASRTKVVAQGANDGMLHLLNAATGAELWAYVPNAVINMSDPSNTGTSTLNMLSRRNGYQHKYFVDGTPVVGDVDFSNTSGVSGNPDPEWKTILVGGLGKGGRGYYALDVTDPTASTESAAAAKVLWEFPNSTTSSTVAANIGYTYGKPIITKTAAYGWVVIVTSGYNNGTGADNSGGTGRGYVWILNAKTGAVLNQIDTGVGTTGAPAGLAHIAGWVDNGNIDNTTTHLYGGDLLGNLWRFDLTDSSGTINYTTQRLAVLRSGSTTTSPTQPITTVPELAEITIGSAAKRFVYVGTGQYMGTSDVDTNQKQTMYGLVDDMSTPNSGDVIPDPIRGGTTPPLVEQTLTTSGTIRTGSSNSLDFATRKGWYIDLPGCSVSSGDSCTKGSERINTDPAVATGVLVFTSNIPNSADPCSPGGSSFFNVVDYKTGAQVTGTSNVSEFLGNALASRVVLIKLPSGSIKALIRLSDATTVSKSVPPPAGGSSPKRMTWREITE